MILVAIAWLYVVLMVAVVEATSDQGTVVGALVTFVFYGLLPLGIVLYLMLSPARRRARRLAEARVVDVLGSADSRVPPDADGSHHPPGDPVAAERKEP